MHSFTSPEKIIEFTIGLKVNVKSTLRGRARHVMPQNKI
ncbi:hypothetical protein TREAZ_1084 [Leadbettera azotonutricia ZAS-9]|uniref:Uncharacterized protein n=1 Tax=Leadbettera azotonutricia (strain ATCC BAA-888 / DSM 13862 / ZAS-9) TaxID=545695 RepID=F5Y7J5_LEAAZ|nr:hypothetical protein TREAZ_1084 [Leadbettera azotonutricia ZAS-9]